MALKDVKIGHMVLVGDNTFKPVYSSFGHFGPDTVAAFLQIKTDSKATLDISANHMLFVEGRGAIPAVLARVGDKLVTSSISKESMTIDSIKEIKAQGLVTPFTPSGKVVVVGVLASSFVVLGQASPDASFFGVKSSHQWMAHLCATTSGRVLMKRTQRKASRLGWHGQGTWVSGCWIKISW